MYGQQVEQKSFAVTPATTLETVLVTMAPKMKGRLLSLVVANVSSTVADTFTLHVRKAGVAASNATKVVPLKAVATSSYVIDAIPANGIGLSAGDIVSVVMATGGNTNVVATVEMSSVNA
jgi:hypothetical protein